MQVPGLVTVLLLALPSDALRIQKSRCFNLELYRKRQAAPGGVSISQLIYKELNQQYQSYKSWARSPAASFSPSSKFLAPSPATASAPSPALAAYLAPAPPSPPVVRWESEVESEAVKPIEPPSLDEQTPYVKSDLQGTMNHMYCEDEPSTILPLLIVLPPFLLPASLLP